MADFRIASLNVKENPQTRFPGTEQAIVVVSQGPMDLQTKRKFLRYYFARTSHTSRRSTLHEFLCSLRLRRLVNTIRRRYAAIRTIIGQAGRKESAKHCLWTSNNQG